MKTKLLGGVLVMTVVLSGSTSLANAANEQVYAKSAPSTAEAIQPVVKVTKVEKPKNKICKNWLVKHLSKHGFRGENLREAWAIVMRESGGNEKTISSTNDYGMFQFNHYAHKDASWWDSKKLLTRDYNTQVAYRKSKGGKTWYMWDIDGHGKWKAEWSPRSTYEKYVSWYNKYPCK